MTYDPSTMPKSKLLNLSEFPEERHHNNCWQWRYRRLTRDKNIFDKHIVHTVEESGWGKRSRRTIVVHIMPDVFDFASFLQERRGWALFTPSAAATPPFRLSFPQSRHFPLHVSIPLSLSSTRVVPASPPPSNLSNFTLSSLPSSTSLRHSLFLSCKHSWQHAPWD